jgi:peptide/nickel transport system permease protein
MGLKKYILRRVFYCLILLFCVMTVQFSIFNLIPGSPMDKYFSSAEQKYNAQDLAEIRKVFGLDEPMHVRYVTYLRSMLTFNFGKTQNEGAPVGIEIQKRVGNTLILLGLAVALAVSLGTLTGTLAAYKRGTKTDTGIVTLSLTLGSLPVFWIGLLMLWVFAVYLKVLPMTGAVPQSWAYAPPKNILEVIAGRLWCLILPVTTLVIFNMHGWALLTRACVLQTITEDYAVTARAKGLGERKVLLKHVLKPASLPLVTSVALAFATIFTGAIITETVFSYEGMGRWLYNSILNKELPIMYAVFFVSAILVISANFLADLFYGFIDPRIKVG